MFSRFQDNITKSGVLFQNDSYEWETKLRFAVVQYFKDWKWSSGFNIQNSSYQNNTNFVRDNLSYIRI